MFDRFVAGVIADGYASRGSLRCRKNHAFFSRIGLIPDDPLAVCVMNYALYQAYTDALQPDKALEIARSTFDLIRDSDLSTDTKNYAYLSFGILFLRYDNFPDFYRKGQLFEIQFDNVSSYLKKKIWMRLIDGELEGK